MRCQTFLTALAAVGAAHAQQLVRSVNGSTAGANYGKAVLRIGDQNNDGYEDLLVGAPGFNANRGAIYCLSGAFLATGAGAKTLWSVTPAVNAGDQFGFAFVRLGDVTGDGVPDFLVGQPGYDDGANLDAGAIRVVSGATHAVVSLRFASAGVRLGSALATCGDSTGDGKTEVAVGEPAPGTTLSGVGIVDGASLLGTGPLSVLTGFGSSGDINTGTSLASGFDLNGDGFQDIAYGVPGWSGAGGTAPNSGACAIASRTTTGAIGVAFYESSIAGERLGESVSAASDYDGDGVVDIVVGAPRSPGPQNTERGRVVVLSGARLAAHTPPYELYVLTPSVSGSTPISLHFGAAVCATRDLDGDGVGDILVGAPDYSTTLPGGAGRGAVSIFSGATGLKIEGLVGSTNDHLGDGLGGAIADLDGDGFKEFVVAGSLSDAGGTDSGVVKCYSLFPCAPSSYCTGKLNSLGCTPAISSSGLPSASAGTPFLITASDFLNQKNGLLFYSHQPLDAPFQGGFLCVANPIVRTPPQNSGGSVNVANCTGRYGFDFAAWIASGSDSSLVAGAEVCAQYWSRDPQSASHTGLSNGLRFLINP